jgi:5'-AMP-activated protein kinase catalytic alpha subunit
MIAGKKYNPLLVDIWSCGVILFAMICGFLPFEDPNTTMLYRKILNCEYETPTHVSENCRFLLSNILNTDPNKRYSINDIRISRWYTMRIPSKITNLFSNQGVNIDEKILLLLENYGFDKE